MELGPLMARTGPKPAAQIHITRPDGSMLLQGCARIKDVPAWVARLAPHVPHDATWQVIDGGANPGGDTR